MESGPFFQLMEPSKSKYEWMYGTFPEMALFETDDERKAALKSVQRHLFGRNWRFWLYGLAVLIVTAIATPSVVGVVLSYGTRWGVSTWVTAPLLVLALITVYYWGIGVLWERSVQQFLRKRLLDAGIAVCLGCGYDLRATEAPRCPECGLASEILPTNDNVI